MFKIQLKVILLNILLVQLKEVYLQVLPISPCLNNFQYRFDGANWFGRLRIENPSNDEPLHLKVTLSVRGNPLTNYLGEIELLTRGRPTGERFTIFYNVKFPLTTIPPRLINIVVNNHTICYGSQDFGSFVTLIQLEHTREFSYLTQAEISKLNDLSNDDTSKKSLSNSSKGKQQVFQILHKTCGKISKSFSKLHYEQEKELIRGTWPWLVAIYVNNHTSLTYICGGTIISHNIVITAAHCFHLYQKMYNANEVLVFLGRNNLHNWNEDGSIVSSVDNIFIHPDYDNNLSSYDADIAIVILKNRIDFNHYIRPVCLWNESKNIEYVENSKGTIIGWGFNNYNVLSTIPKKLQTHIVTNTECIKADKKYGNIISSRTFCAGGDLPCVGYSGVGLMLFRNNKWRLRGIVSASLPGSCNSNKFVIYTDVSKFLDWIYAFIL